VFCSFLDQVEINPFFSKKKKNQSPGLCEIALKPPPVHVPALHLNNNNNNNKLKLTMYHGQGGNMQLQHSQALALALCVFV
jgi:hypothetical protein